METFSIPNPESYRREYARLGNALGVPDAQPAAGEVEFLCGIAAQSCVCSGMLSEPEILFAGAIASILRPRLTVEIGTGSGSSAAILARVICLRRAELGESYSGPLLHTIDNKTHCLFNAAKPIGFAIELLAPSLRERIALHPLRDSSDCKQIVNGAGIDFAFVDGNHSHPWPLCDVLHLQELMKAGDWILMHDIDLPAAIGRAIASGQEVDWEPSFGAKHVFDYWPGAKIISGNIGAIRIPDDRRSLGEFVARMRTLPSEVAEGSWTKRWRMIDELMKPPRRRFFANVRLFSAR